MGSRTSGETRRPGPGNEHLLYNVAVSCLSIPTPRGIWASDLPIWSDEMWCFADQSSSSEHRIDARCFLHLMIQYHLRDHSPGANLCGQQKRWKRTGNNRKHARSARSPPPVPFSPGFSQCKNRGGSCITGDLGCFSFRRGSLPPPLALSSPGRDARYCLPGIKDGAKTISLRFYSVIR